MLDKACQRFGAGMKEVDGRTCSSWSEIRVGAGKQVDFCRGFVLSRAEGSKVVYFTSDKAYEHAETSQCDVGKRQKNTV